MKKILRFARSKLLPNTNLNHLLKFKFSTLNFQKVNSEQIQNFLRDSNLEFKIKSNGQIVVKACPICPKPHNNIQNNLWTLNIKSENGAFLCFRCGNSGSWTDFVKEQMTGEMNFFPGSSSDSGPTISHEQIMTFQSEKIINLENTHKILASPIEVDSIGEINLNRVKMLHYLTNNSTGRALNYETLSKYGIGIGQELFKNVNGQNELVDCVYFPMFCKEKPKKKDSFLMVKAKIRGLYSKDKHFMRIYPSNAKFGIFGIGFLSKQDNLDSVIITEGEFDAMSAYQATGIPAISLPYGASSFPPALLDYIESIHKVYLWMDFDDIGQLNVKTYADKIGPSKTFVVKELPVEEIEKILMGSDFMLKTTEEKMEIQVQIEKFKKNGIKDANDALKISSTLITEYIKNAKTFPQMNIVQFGQLRDLVRERIFHQDRFRGVPSLFFSWFNSLVKGFRRGEFINKIVDFIRFDWIWQNDVFMSI